MKRRLALSSIFSIFAASLSGGMAGALDFLGSAPSAPEAELVEMNRPELGQREVTVLARASNIAAAKCAAVKLAVRHSAGYPLFRADAAITVLPDGRTEVELSVLFVHSIPPCP